MVQLPAPLLIEKSRQAQFLKPMAISITFGIAYATVLTLLALPVALSISNNIKVGAKWLATGNQITKEEVERAIKEKDELEQPRPKDFWRSDYQVNPRPGVLRLKASQG